MNRRAAAKRRLTGLKSKIKRTIAGLDRRFEAVFLAAILVAIGLSLSLFFRSSGIPPTHEVLSFMQRTVIYADHFRQGDLFPMWAASDAFSMGTPQPLFYHKTFYYVSGLLFMLLGSVKLAVAATMGLWMIVGAYGMRLAVGMLTSSRALKTAAPVVFLLANYTFTDWLVRGAMAEFTAMMLIPGLIWWCFMLIRNQHFSWLIVPILYLLFQAHNVSALFGILLAAIAVVMYIAQQRLDGVKRWWKRALVSGLLFALLLAPQLILQKASLADYDPSKITQSGFQASNNYKPAKQYLWDGGYEWLVDPARMTVQLDVGIWILPVLCVAVLVAWVVDRSRSKRTHRDWAKLAPVLIFLGISLVFFTFMQIKLSRQVYEVIAPLQFLQFPWRLLAYLTPLSILAVALALAMLLRRQRWLVLASVIWASSFIAFSPLLHNYKYAFIPESTVTSVEKASDREAAGRILAGIGEYYPRVKDGYGKELPAKETVYLYEAIFDEKRQLQVLDGYCEVRAVASERLEPLKKRFDYTCDSSSVVALPISFSRLTYVKNVRTGEIVPRFRQPTDPRIQVNLMAGSGSIEVYLPSTGTIGGMLWNRLVN